MSESPLEGMPAGPQFRPGETITFEEDGRATTFVVDDEGTLEFIGEITFDKSAKIRVSFAADRVVRTAAEETQSGPSPPTLGLFLLGVFAPADRRQAMLGDIVEQFQKNIGRHGVHEARRLLYLDAIISLGPMAWQAVKRLSIWGVILEGTRRIFLG